MSPCLWDWLPTHHVFVSFIHSRMSNGTRYALLCRTHCSFHCMRRCFLGERCFLCERCFLSERCFRASTHFYRWLGWRVLGRQATNLHSTQWDDLQQLWALIPEHNNNNNVNRALETWERRLHENYFGITQRTVREIWKMLVIPFFDIGELWNLYTLRLMENYITVANSLSTSRSQQPAYGRAPQLWCTLSISASTSLWLSLPSLSLLFFQDIILYLS